MSRNKSEYDKIRAIWYDRLEKEGFTDIEQDEYCLKQWSTKFATPSFVATYKEKSEYYHMATRFLNDFKFLTELDRVIWEYHTNGLSHRDIAKLLNAAKVCKTDRNRVRRTLKALRQQMRLLLWADSPETDECYDG